MYDYQAIAALAAVVHTGSFDKAAQQLGVTASAISQRIKLLEERMGSVLVVRAQPCYPTPTGKRLVQHAEQVALLEQAVAQDLGQNAGAGEAVTIRIAVNADSLATWFVEALAGADDGLLYDLVVDDQDHSSELLARGEVSAAISGKPGAVQGCNCVPLGALRYMATASPAFVKRWFADGVTAKALSVAPCMTFNIKDRLQANWAERLTGQRMVLPTHWLPSTHGFVDAALAGLGWGMNPEPLVRAHVAAGRLISLSPSEPHDVPLFWHVSRLAAPALEPLSRKVRAVAARHLV
ncbi:MAG: ArgP/LysG family DNA-binding transcriptional regulator [Alphaproteobacteria bacterium]|nr:ArgP/LysG family DNA-binding transcriptional regulator [Alphaproteobacteria bacterium]MAS46900.1 ArgP/LysG family DNA-binding transcriptional regulator [Alphaproteobacteria bacterium]MBN53550.1 ArgP/LysG family DNA-binding transcriptional regulator [Alphaproteobacteria bacterium]OUT41538.1 MAG: ArgP/LysG family DNA-binding transcriptional regulator [Micavibrio sp. TMED2]|tara:strand:+ start:3853 stop:4734 length:882 start_codon:yes stop_codon:yes gene_type:complete